MEVTKSRAVPQARQASRATNVEEHAQLPALAHSRETLDPRLELLHAHVVHRTSGIVQEQWRQSAYGFYEKQFLALQKRNMELNEKERDHMEQRNAAAVLSWANRAEGVTIDQQIAKASAIVDEVWKLSAPDGKYSLAVQAFEHWFQAAQIIQSGRARRYGAGARLDVIEGLGDGWKAEVSALQATVLEAANNVVTLGEITPEGSDLQRCITLVSESLTHMLEELEMIVQIEESMVGEERDWVQGAVNNIATNLRDGLRFG